MRRTRSTIEQIFYEAIEKYWPEGYKICHPQWRIDCYYVDFAFVDLVLDDGQRLVVEIDGPEHALQKQEDAQRDANHRLGGFEVVRYTNSDVIRDAIMCVDFTRRTFSQLPTRTKEELLNLDISYRNRLREGRTHPLFVTKASVLDPGGHNESGHLIHVYEEATRRLRSARSREVHYQAYRATWSELRHPDVPRCSIEDVRRYYKKNVAEIDKEK